MNDVIALHNSEMVCRAISKLETIRDNPIKKPYTVLRLEIEDDRGKERRHIFALINQIVKHGHKDEYGQEHSTEGWHFKLKLEFGYVADCITRDVGGGLFVDIPIPKSLSNSTKGEERMSLEEAKQYRWRIEEYMSDHNIPINDPRGEYS